MLNSQLFFSGYFKIVQESKIIEAGHVKPNKKSKNSEEIAG